MSAPSDASWRRTNLGHLLFAAASACSASKLRVVCEAGFDCVSDAQFALFENLDRGGTRLTTLATRAGMTKQSMIELVDKAERQGLVERLPETDDKRAKTVRFTAQGATLRTAIKRGVAVAEQELAASVGPDRLMVIHSEISSQSRGRASIVSTERLLLESAREFVRNVLTAVHRRGYHDVSEPLLALFRTLDLAGSRLTEVAAAGRITKQSMRLLIERAEMLGLVERMPDRRDGRAKIIRFTAAGLIMLDDMRRGIGEVETAFATARGDTLLYNLKECLSTFLADRQH